MQVLTVNFYEGSYQFETKQLEINGFEGLDTVFEVLRSCHHYRKSNERLWASVAFPGMTLRFEYNKIEDKLNEI